MLNLIREKELNERQLKLELIILQDQLNSSRENAKFARDVALGLVRNTEFRNSVFESVSNIPVPVNGPSGSSGWVGTSNQPKNTTTNTSHQAI